MRAKSVLFAALGAAAILALVGCEAFFVDWGFDINDYRYRFEDSFEADLAGAELVSITIVNGPITIETWDRDRVEIEVHERVKARDEEEAEELADEIRLIGNPQGSELAIELDYGDFYHRRRNYYCELEVRLPRTVSLRLRTTNGSIAVPEMDGDVHADTTNGHISLDGCGGDAALVSTNGNINAAGVEGELRAETTNGDLELETAAGPVRGDSTNGNITLRLTDVLDGDVELDTTNGSVTLIVTPGCSFRIIADTTNGHVSDSLSDDEFDGEYNRRRTRLEGRYGDGRHLIRLDTTTGSIRIEED